jgi:hypothetical protein
MRVTINYTVSTREEGRKGKERKGEKERREEKRGEERRGEEKSDVGWRSGNQIFYMTEMV